MYSLHNNENNRREIKINLLESDETLIFSEDNLNLKLHGDILIELYNYRFVKSKKKLGRISFNTSFIDRKSNTLEFELREIDPYEFSIKTNVRTDYKIKLTFEKVCENDSMYCNDISLLRAFVATLRGIWKNKIGKQRKELENLK